MIDKDGYEDIDFSEVEEEEFHVDMLYGEGRNPNEILDDWDEIDSNCK
jgi:hypothetical protein